MSGSPGRYHGSTLNETGASSARSGRTDGSLVEDNLPEDMSLVLDTDKGLVLISGCGHAGIINTLEYARRKIRETQIHAALGGFHLFEADAATLDWTADKLRSMGLENFLGAHCTGIEAVFGLAAAARAEPECLCRRARSGRDSA